MISLPDPSYEVTSSTFVDGYHDCDLNATLAKAVWCPYDVEICCQCLPGSFELACPECGEKLVCKDAYTVTKHGFYDQKIIITLERWMCNNPDCKAECKSHVLLPESLIPRLWYPAVVLKLCLDLIDPETLGLNHDEIKYLRAFKSGHARLLRRWKQKLCTESPLPKPPAPPPFIMFYLCSLCICSCSERKIYSGRSVAGYRKITAKPQPSAEKIIVFAIEIRASGPGPPCLQLSRLWHCHAMVLAIPYSHRETDRSCRACFEAVCSGV